ncbi:MAG: pyridoxamine 5'-phosphate oxidase family protein [Erysipelotrichaceae bacterium]|nr:pyridoxamine 5'-phosphate oxidase family protein [Erysipelotrichaceae bacterium]MDD3809208.1 pyridoxamine 5'-phosphate oxidase family protein [Erysipelotrichaceae bacterium]
MFREMRRFKQKLNVTECEEILKRNTSGTLALLGDGGYPYAVPLSYVYVSGKIFFHCAKAGHKIDAIKNYDKASFCIIDKDKIVPEEYTTYFRSVIAFGKIRIIADTLELEAALNILAKKYSPDQVEGRQKEIEQQISRVAMIELRIEHLSGKEAIELR